MRMAIALAALLLALSPALATRAQMRPPPEGAPTTPALKRLLDGDGGVERIASGFSFADGPAWIGAALVFADPPRSLLLRADSPVAVVREDTGGASDLAVDADGRLVLASRAARQLVRIEDGETSVVADRVGNAALNGPTDLVIADDGRIFAVDPPLGSQPDGRNATPRGRIVLVTPAGVVSVAVDDLIRPTGLALSPDERTLYVSDAGRSELRAYAIGPAGRVGAGRRLASIVPWKGGVRGAPDGLALDEQGRVYLAGPCGVWVLDANGGRLGVIATPETPTACAFGADDGRTLYITARTSLYKVRLTVPGAR